MNVNFYIVALADWATLQKDSKAFYIVEGDGRYDLYLGTEKLTSGEDIADLVANVAKNAADIASIIGRDSILNITPNDTQDVFDPAGQEIVLSPEDLKTLEETGELKIDPTDTDSEFVPPITSTDPIVIKKDEDGNITVEKEDGTALGDAELVEGPDAIEEAIAELESRLADVAYSGAAADVAFVDDSDNEKKIEATNVKDALIELRAKIQQAAEADEIEVVKQDEAEDGFAATYYITQGGVQAGEKINIPKDYFVRDADVKTVEEEDNPKEGFKVGQKYIDIEVNVVDETDPKHMYILCDDVITPYSVEENAEEIQLAISENNEISASVVAVPANKVVYKPEETNKVATISPVSPAGDDYFPADGQKIVLSEADAQALAENGEVTIDPATSDSVFKPEAMSANPITIKSDDGENITVVDAGSIDIGSGTVADVTTPAQTIDQTLDELVEEMGEGVEETINQLNADVSATEGKVITGIKQEKGIITEITETALAAENVTAEGLTGFDGEVKDVKAALEQIADHLTWKRIPEPSAPEGEDTP